MTINISIIMPVYNKGKYLKRSIDSVLNSDFEDYELICVEDYSSDDSAIILGNYAKKYGQIKVLCNEQNMGVAFSRNRGIEEASGKYVMFLDADDSVEKDALESYYMLMEKHRAQMCFIKFAQLSGNRSQGIIKKYEGVYSGVQLLDLFTENHEDFLYACGAMYERTFLTNNLILFEKLTIGEGGLFILNALLKADRAVVSDYPGYYYWINETSTSQQSFALTASAKGQLSQILYLIKYLRDESKQEDAIVRFLEWYVPLNIGGIQNLCEEDILSVIERENDAYSLLMIKLLLGEFVFKKINIDENIEKIIKEREKVYLYGAGYDILSVIRYCHQIGAEICGIFVSSLAVNSKCVYGYKIQEFREEIIDDKSIPIIITARKKHQNQIETMLLDAEIKYIVKL